MAAPAVLVQKAAELEVGCQLADVLRIRVRNAEPADLRAVARDVGCVTQLDAGAPSGVPRLDISFVDGMSTSALGILDGNSVGYAGTGVYALAGHDAPRAFVEQGSAWGAGSIVCTRGLRRIPFLPAAIDLASIAADWAPLHASGWVTPEGVGVIASGWAHSGKTGALLAAYEHGARPIGDDRILLAPDGSLMLGLGRPVQAKDWHIAQLEGLRRTAGSSRAALARAGFRLASRRKSESRSGWGRLVERALTKARGVATLEIALHAETKETETHPRARPHLLVLLETHADDRIVAEPADPASVAARLAAHACADLVPTLRAQLAYTYVHPETGWRDVDRAPAMVTKILDRAVRGMPAWTVRHPYPCSLERMHEVTSELAASVA